jgi:hypothetical protein
MFLLASVGEIEVMFSGVGGRGVRGMADGNLTFVVGFSER